MAAPRTTQEITGAPQYYASPNVVPASWTPDRPGDIEGFQPVGARLGAQGPDQGFALTIASRLAPKLELKTGEHIDDAVRGCVGIALRRASLFSRAPVVHDVRLAFTIWGFFDVKPPSELVERRRELFEGVANVNHHYTAGRIIADLVPESTLRLTPEQAAVEYPAGWRALTGA